MRVREDAALAVSAHSDVCTCVCIMPTICVQDASSTATGSSKVRHRGSVMHSLGNQCLPKLLFLLNVQISGSKSIIWIGYGMHLNCAFSNIDL